MIKKIKKCCKNNILIFHSLLYLAYKVKKKAVYPMLTRNAGNIQKNKC